MKPLILITNDDGIEAPGIWHLWNALKDFGDIVIVAPEQDRSCVGLGATVKKPLFLKEARWLGEAEAWKVNGTPSDCVKLALHHVLDRKPDIIVSGINRGANSGRNVLYSGTVGGVIEGVLRDIPGVAFSCSEFMNPNYERAEKHILKIVEYTLNNTFPKGTFLNVNFPCHVDEIKGFKLAKQGLGYWMDAPEKREHPEGLTYFWLGWKVGDFEEDELSDIHLIQEGYITAVPLQVNEMTNHQFLEEKGVHFEEACNEALTEV